MPDFDPDALDRRDPRVITAAPTDEPAAIREHVRARMQAALDELAAEATP